MLKRNLIANYLGQGWTALMGLAFIPLYIKYLGMEAYGLIGLFAVLQAWLNLLDMGMAPTLGREMARFIGGTHTAESIRDLLRSIEVIALGIALLASGGVALGSNWIASDWLQAESLPVEIVAQAFSLMGLVVALRFFEGIYRSSIVGLQRQVLFNLINSSAATLRGFGAVVVLAWVSPTIQAFFLWQVLLSIATVVILAGATYTTLPRGERAGRFSFSVLRPVWRFAGGMVSITFLSILLTQVDKVLLSSQLPLEAFGHYVLAGAIAGSLSVLSSPIGTAYYPRYIELVARVDEVQLRQTFHQSAQMLTIFVAAAAVMLIVFGDRVLLIWTRDAELAERVAPLLRLLAWGTMLHAVSSLVYFLQLAHGVTSITIKVSCVAVAILIPSLLMVVPRYGAIGAAGVWAALNTATMLVTPTLVFRRLLVTEKWRWYVKDVSMPLAAAIVTALTARLVMPEGFGTAAELLFLIATGAAVVLAAVIAAPFALTDLCRVLLRTTGWR